MKAFLLAIVAIFAIAFGAQYGLDRMGFSAAEQQSSDSVRLN